MSSAAPQTVASLPPLPPPRRRHWLTLLLMLVIFVSGFAMGSAGSWMVLRKMLLSMLHHPEQAAPQIAVRLGSRFGWSKKETAQVEKVIRAHQENLQAIRRDVQPRVLSELKQMEDEIAAVLTPRQQAAWHASCAQQARIWIPEMQPSEPSPGKSR